MRTALPAPGPPYDRLVSPITSFKATSGKRQLEKASSWRGVDLAHRTLLNGRLGKEMDAQCDRLRNLDELAVGAACLVAEHVERPLVVDRVPLHQDALGPLRDRPTGKRAFKAVILGEPRQHDVE